MLVLQKSPLDRPYVYPHIAVGLRETCVSFLELSRETTAQARGCGQHCQAFAFSDGL